MSPRAADSGPVHIRTSTGIRRDPLNCALDSTCGYCQHIRPGNERGRTSDGVGNGSAKQGRNWGRKTEYTSKKGPLLFLLREPMVPSAVLSTMAVATSTPALESSSGELGTERSLPRLFHLPVYDDEEVGTLHGQSTRSKSKGEYEMNKRRAMPDPFYSWLARSWDRRPREKN